MITELKNLNDNAESRADSEKHELSMKKNTTLIEKSNRNIINQSTVLKEIQICDQSKQIFENFNENMQHTLLQQNVNSVCDTPKQTHIFEQSRENVQNAAEGTHV